MKTTALCLLIACALPLHAQIRLPRLVSDNMILQRNSPVRIWGWASPGEKIQATFHHKKYTALTAKDSTWSFTLPPMAAGGPYDLDLRASNHVSVKNILFGDVWVCSGQSNMELSMQRLKDKYPQVIQQAENPFIRQFSVTSRAIWTHSANDYETGSWMSATPATILSFSAVGYFFAKELYERYHVPIGLIRAAVGGSTAEAWLSKDALKKFPQYDPMLRNYARTSYTDSLKARENTINTAWYTTLWQNDKGLHDTQPWYAENYDTANWRQISVPGFWADQTNDNDHGVRWYRKEIVVNKNMAGKEVQLWLGNIVDRDSVYINGHFIGTTGYQYPPRKYPVPAGTLREGKNSIVVRVINYSGEGGFYKDKPYYLFSGGDTVRLDGEWQFRVGAIQAPIAAIKPYYEPPAGLFQGMIAPMLPYAIKGVIWYQGEANANNPTPYQQIFPALIRDWRRQWNNDFPFLYVQLANYMESKPYPTESNWAKLREAQLKTLSVPNTGMAVIIDIGEWNDIHPLNKQDVGKRLSLLAQYLAYGEKDVESAGPLFHQLRINENKALISFTHTSKGLHCKGAALQEFAIAGQDKKFYPAHAEITGNTIRVWSEQVPQPVAVRYAWANNPAHANLYNGAGLPASPFRTDNW